MPQERIIAMNADTTAAVLNDTDLNDKAIAEIKKTFNSAHREDMLIKLYNDGKKEAFSVNIDVKLLKKVIGLANMATDTIRLYIKNESVIVIDVIDTDKTYGFSFIIAPKVDMVDMDNHTGFEG